MSEKTYKVVFSGDLAFDTDADEARAQLANKCKYKPETIDKIISGHKLILKKGLDEASANRYKNFFDQMGVLADVHREEPEPLPQSDFFSHEPVTPVVRQGRTCPKCQAENQADETCEQCGLIFARFDSPPPRQTATFDQLQPQQEEPDKSYFDKHPEQLFILQAFGVILLILLLKSLLNDFLPLFILLFPIGFLTYIRLQAAASGESATQMLAQHITFMPVMYAKDERPQQYVPKVTYGLILSNLLIFYLFQLTTPVELTLNNLVFLPYQPTAFNIPLSLFSSLFLHGGQGHLWGNMLFLWAVGTVVERRIGAWKFIVFYLLSGIGANLLYLLICQLAGTPAHILGASGAIAGVMGIFAVRCYFKSMVFPLPILGIFSLFLPVSLKVRLNSLVIIGLFFLADLSGGIEQIQGSSNSNIGHWAHIGGMLCGILLAMAFKMNEEAILERHMELGSQAVGAAIGSGNTKKGEESLRMLLKKDPGNTEAQLLLARLRTKFAASEEGRKLYEQVLPKLVIQKPEEAMIAYHEFNRNYSGQLDSDTLYRLATVYHRHEDLEMATHCLEKVCNDEKTAPLVLEKSLFQCARILESQEHFDAAKLYYQSCIDKFPKSALSVKAQARLEQSQFTELAPY